MPEALNRYAADSAGCSTVEPKLTTTRKVQLDAARFAVCAVAPVGTLAQGASCDRTTRGTLRRRAGFYQLGYGRAEIEVTIAIGAGTDESKESACRRVQRMPLRRRRPSVFVAEVQVHVYDADLRENFPHRGCLDSVGLQIIAALRGSTHRFARGNLHRSGSPVGKVRCLCSARTCSMLRPVLAAMTLSTL